MMKVETKIMQWTVFVLTAFFLFSGSAGINASAQLGRKEYVGYYATNSSHYSMNYATRGIAESLKHQHFRSLDYDTSYSGNIQHEEYYNEALYRHVTDQINERLSMDKLDIVYLNSSTFYDPPYWADTLRRLEYSALTYAVIDKPFGSPDQEYEILRGMYPNIHFSYFQYKIAAEKLAHLYADRMDDRSEDVIVFGIDSVITNTFMDIMSQRGVHTVFYDCMPMYYGENVVAEAFRSGRIDRRSRIVTLIPRLAGSFITYLFWQEGTTVAEYFRQSMLCTTFESDEFETELVSGSGNSYFTFDYSALHGVWEAQMFDRPHYPDVPVSVNLIE